MYNTDYHIIIRLLLLDYQNINIKMEVQDYEYYEARAKGVKLKDITSSKKNADILARLRDNDPKFPRIHLTFPQQYRGGRINFGDFVVREGDHSGWMGYFVGKSKKLKTLNIYNCFQENGDLNAFLRGLGHNRSIQELHISVNLGESFKILTPFLRNNDNLRNLNFRFSYLNAGVQCARNIALLLSQKSFLKHLNFDDIDLDDVGLVEIAAALKSQPQIEELCFNSSKIVRDGYVALGNALECCPSLKVLQLWVDSDIEDDDNSNDWLDSLAAGLKHCHNLTLLSLQGNQMKEGSRSLSTFFQSDNCRLEHLFLGNMNIDSDGARTLAAGLASLPSLKRLDLSENSIGDQGLKAVAEGLVGCNLEELYLSDNELADSVSGLISLGMLMGKTSSMKKLCLYNSSLTDEGLQSFVEGMSNCCNLTKLDLPWNRLITANGLASLSSLFRAEQCSLRILDLYGIHLGDDGAAVLANGLVGNKSLTNLYFNFSGITERGWAAFSRLLCNTSSVNDTYLSNHTLERISEVSWGMRAPPSDIEDYLHLNKSYNQAAAISKIVDSHPDIDVTPLFEFNLKCLPLVVAWLEEAKSYVSNVNESIKVFQCRQLSAVYKFIRGMPLLAANGYRGQKAKDIQSDGKKKRKFDLTL